MVAGVRLSVSVLAMAASLLHGDAIYLRKSSAAYLPPAPRDHWPIAIAVEYELSFARQVASESFDKEQLNRFLLEVSIARRSSVRSRRGFKIGWPSFSCIGQMRPPMARSLFSATSSERRRYRS